MIQLVGPALSLSALTLFVSCRCGSEEEVVADDAAVITAQEGGTTPDEGGVTASEAVEEPQVDDDFDGTLHVKIRDFQIFHPDSKSRAIRDPADLTKVRRIQGGGNVAIGVVFEVRNSSPYLLESPRLISELRWTGLHGTARCQVRPSKLAGAHHGAVKVLSSTGGKQAQWVDESQDALESPWRPQETIRLSAVLHCGLSHIADLELDRLEGIVAVAARPQYESQSVQCERDIEVCDDDIMGSSPPVDLPARFLSLQQVELDESTTAYLAGDLLISTDNGQLLRESLAERGLSALTIAGRDLPETPPAITERSDEWTFDVSKVAIRHWLDVAGTPKGKRIITVSVKLSIDSKALETRLRGAIDAARRADSSAREKLQKAQQAYQQALGGDEEVVGKAQTSMREADVEARRTSGSLSQALSAYERTLRSERTRLARLLPCDRVELVTHKRRVRATNISDAAAICRTLDSVDSAQLSWSYQIDRYEIPLGVALTVGNEPKVAFFAARSLTRFDPR